MVDAAAPGWRSRLEAWQIPGWGTPLLLLLVCVASYGLLVPVLGFYWDDFPISWIGETYGTAGLARYFSTNRPYWGWLYQLTVPVLGSQQPVTWQLFNLFWRWLSAVALWSLLRLAWPHQSRLAVWAALLFLVFPAFRQQSIALLYSHFFIVLSLFLLSQILTLAALRRYGGHFNTAGYWLLTFLALLCSLYNLLAMEYFFILELVRGIFIVYVVSEQVQTWRQRAGRTLLAWLPYLVIFIGAVIWRMFFFSFQTQNYQMVFLQRLRVDGASALLLLGQNILYSLWVAGPGGWLDVFRLTRLTEMGKFTLLSYLALVILMGFLLSFILMHLSSAPSQANRRKTALGMLVAGLGTCLLAGWPFWLTEVLPGSNFPLDRFTLPFALGMSLAGAGLVGLLPLRMKTQALLLGILLALAVGYQFRVSNDYRRDWEAAQRFFWQFAWRIPGLKPGTMVLSNRLPLQHYSDNSLTAPLNRMYAPGNASEDLSYLLYYPEQRLGKSLTSLAPNTPVYVNYLAAEFRGSTSQAVVFIYDPPGCLRILDPELDWENRMLPTLLQNTAGSSNASLILPAGEPELPPTLFGPEPDHRWCYFFEKADLARQQKDWETLVALGDQAFDLGDYPNDPAERIPFIEGYAHTEKWEQALEQTRLAAHVAPAVELVLCRLWQRIAGETPVNSEQAKALAAAFTELNCVR